MTIFMMLATIICLIVSIVLFIVGLIRLLIKKGWNVLLYSIFLFILSTGLYRIGQIIFAGGKLMNLR